MTNSHLYKTTASTLQKVANLPRIRNPADLVHPDIRPIRQQRLEIDGQLGFGKNLYFSPAQEKLVKELLPLRTSFRNSPVQQRSEIALSEFNLWKNYLDSQVAEIPSAEKIEGQIKQKVYESYLIGKERNQEKMQLNKTARLFHHLSLAFKFDVAIHPQVLLRMVYPYYGYLNTYSEQRLGFEDYIKFLEEMIAVSRLFSEGSTLHGSELLSFVFWKSYSNKTSMQLQDFCQFLTNFKFNTKPESFANDFSYHLRNRESEIKDGNPVRFDLFRGIFLERGL